MGRLPVMRVCPTTVELGINPGFAQLGLEIMARCGRPRLPTETEAEMAGILFAIPVCTLADSVAVFPLSFLYSLCPARFLDPLFLLLTPENSALTELYLQALSFPLSLISEETPSFTTQAVCIFLTK